MVRNLNPILPSNTTLNRDATVDDAESVAVTWLAILTAIQIAGS
jgi:hypothetical protein